MTTLINPGRVSVRKANNAGIVTTTGGNDLVHTLATGRSFFIRKIVCYQATGAPVTLQFGTLDRGVPAFVAMMPLLVAISGVDNIWDESQIPVVEWISWPQATAAGRTGDLYVLASAATATIVCEIEEFE